MIGDVELMDVPADGNCFFSALSLALHDFDRAKMWTRPEIVQVKQLLLENLQMLLRERWLDHSKSAPPDIQGLLNDETLVRRLCTEFAWAESSEAILASRLLRRRIQVFALFPGAHHPVLGLDAAPPRRRRSEADGASGAPPLVLLVISTKDGKRDHYQAVRRAKGASGFAAPAGGAERGGVGMKGGEPRGLLEALLVAGGLCGLLGLLHGFRKKH